MIHGMSAGNSMNDITGSSCRGCDAMNNQMGGNMNNNASGGCMNNVTNGGCMNNVTNSGFHMNQRMNQSQLLDWVSMLGFCAYDMLLYLDTHPTDVRALDYYEQCNQLYQNAKASYEESYGPLTIAAAGEKNGCWDWGKQPLPWEGVI